MTRIVLLECVHDRVLHRDSANETIFIGGKVTDRSVAVPVRYKSIEVAQECIIEGMGIQRGRVDAFNAIHRAVHVQGDVI